MRRNRSSTLAMAVFATAIAVSGTASAQSTTPAPCAAATYRQFDFWIGKWEVFTPDGKRAGSSVIEPIANGCALLENWQPVGPGSGKSLNSFDRRDGQWHQSWVDASGGRLELVGSGGDGTMMLAANGQRITWTANADGSVRQLWESWDAKADAWKVAFDGRYVKVP